MFDMLGDATCACIAAGCETLASLWASAWQEGGGSNIGDDKLAAIAPDVLKVSIIPRPSCRLTS